MAKVKTHEPLFRVSRRLDIVWWKAWLIRLGAIVAALLVCGLIIFALTGLNPIEVYAAMIDGSFGSERKIWTLLKETAMLLGIALALTPAFKMRFWNLGGQGQVLVSGLACAACLFYLGSTLPNWLMLLVMCAVGMLSGMVWALIPAIFKANWNTNETLFTLMMNYVAVQLVTFSIAVWVPSGSGVLPILNADTKIGWLPAIGDKQYLFSILAIALVTIFMFVYLKYTKHGYEIAVVGESLNTARYIGVNVKKVIIRTMLLSGAICGLVGFLMVGNGHTVSASLDGGYGFTAVLVSWLAQFNPIVMVFTSLLIAFLQKGAGALAMNFGLDGSISDIVTAIILFFIIGCEFFINYEIHFRRHTRKEAAKA